MCETFGAPLRMQQQHRHQHQQHPAASSRQPAAGRRQLEIGPGLAVWTSPSNALPRSFREASAKTRCVLFIARPYYQRARKNGASASFREASANWKNVHISQNTFPFSLAVMSGDVLVNGFGSFRAASAKLPQTEKTSSNKTLFHIIRRFIQKCRQGVLERTSYIYIYIYIYTL